MRKRPFYGYTERGQANYSRLGTALGALYAGRIDEIYRHNTYGRVVLHPPQGARQRLRIVGARLHTQDWLHMLADVGHRDVDVQND